MCLPIDGNGHPRLCRLRPKLPSLSEDQLSRHLGPSRPLAGLTSLNLHNCGLKRVEGLSSLKDSLTSLVLTFNEIIRIEGVRGSIVGEGSAGGGGGYN